MELISQIGIVNWWAILAATALAFLLEGFGMGHSSAQLGSRHWAKPRLI